MLRLLSLLLIGIMAISTASIFIKLCEAPALVIAAYRMSLASLILLPLAGYKRIWRGWNRKEFIWIILSGLFLGLHFTFWIASLKFTSVASSVVLVSTNPLFVGLGGWLFFKESLGLNLMSGILLSIIGSGLISFGDMTLSMEALLGDGLALLGALTASGYLLIGRKMRKEKALLSYIFPVYAVSAILLILLSLSFKNPFFGFPSSTYLYLFLLALIPQLIGHTTFNWALRYLPPSIVAIAILGEPIGSTLLAYFILKEGLSSLKIIGGVLILFGISIVLRKKGLSS
ncbi:MAG: DMT family transporter [Thermodesulfobacteriota bacterium]